MGPSNIHLVVLRDTCINSFILNILHNTTPPIHWSWKYNDLCKNYDMVITERYYNMPVSLQRRHNGCDSVSNHQPHDCLINRLFRLRSKKTSKPRVTGLCAGNSPGTGEFPAQMASNAENVSIWWRHYDKDNRWQWRLAWYYWNVFLINLHLNLSKILGKTGYIPLDFQWGNCML